MQINYWSLALLQEMFYFHNLREVQKIRNEIVQLQSIIFSRQKKHRRCDKDLIKSYYCFYCCKMYASDVALKLHHKIKHLKEHQKEGNKDTVSRQDDEQDATPESI